MHRIAHAMGIRTNITMLYGQIEMFAYRVDHDPGVVHRFDAKGIRDVSGDTGAGFAGTGKVVAAFHPKTLAIDDGDRILLAGQDDAKQGYVARYTSDGLLDSPTMEWRL